MKIPSWVLRVKRAERKARVQYIVCYEAGDETGGLDLEDGREKRRSAVSLPSLGRVPEEFTGNAYWCSPD